MTSFSDLSLDPRVLQAVTESGYITPTPIQIQGIPHALEGRDVLGIAQTGTGKTGAFVLPMITHLSKGRARARMPRSLVLCPTRELAAQVAEQFEKYSAHVKLSMALLIGGVSFKDQDKLIDRGVDVLIATPGRLLDHFERGKLMLTGVQIMVVDEADRMLDMGFIPDIERIFKLVPFTRQTLFFSATMPPEIVRLTEEFLHTPVRVEVARQASVVETIDQFVCRHAPRRRDTADQEKRELLRRLIRREGEALTNGIIFCNRKRDVDVVAKSLKRHGFDAEAMHGDLDQKLRMKILPAFRDGELKLLIASDVAARGLDIPNVSHIFNFDVPIHSEDYVHRIGRTGRAGRSGKSITLCLPFEEKYLAKIEELVKKPIPPMESPFALGETLPEPRARRRPAAPGAWPPQRAPGRASPRRQPQPAPTPAGGGPEAPRRTHGGRSEAVAGMGDHVPAFLMRELRVADAPEGAEEPALEPAAEPAAEPEKAAAPRRRSRARSRTANVAEAVPRRLSLRRARRLLPALGDARAHRLGRIRGDQPEPRRVLGDRRAVGGQHQVPPGRAQRRRHCRDLGGALAAARRDVADVDRPHPAGMALDDAGVHLRVALAAVADQHEGHVRVQPHHRLDQVPLVVDGAARQRRAQADPPLAQEQDRADRNLVALEERLEDLVDAPGRARDVEHRVALRARNPGVQRAIERRDPRKHRAAGSVLHEQPPEHRRLVGDAGVHDGVVDVRDHHEPRALGRNEHLRRRRDPLRREHRQLQPVPEPVAQAPARPGPSRPGNTRRGR